MAGRKNEPEKKPSAGEPTDPPPEVIDRILEGDVSALAELFSEYRPRLWRMVNFRLHPRLRGRVDPDDVLQDAWMRAVDRIGYFLRDAARSPFIWFRMIVCQTMIDLHRHHLGTEKRDAEREQPLASGWSSEATSTSLGFQLMGHLTSPSSAVAKAEMSKQVDTALQGMDPIDREVLALRHFEELSNLETARVLDVSEQAASARYIRALRRLKDVLHAFPGFADALKPPKKGPA
jgi:RNA polymerase sigma-70 factor (ECF subfamily)